MSDKNEKYRKIVTAEFRVSYPSLVEPSSFDENQPKKFSVVALFEVNNMDEENKKKFAELKQFATDTAKAAWGDNMPKNLRSPFMDGDTKPDKDGYPGTTYCNFKSKERPTAVNHAREEILDLSEIFGGCYARATVTCYAYGTGTRIQGNKPPGVAFGLQNLQKLRDGEPFSSRSHAEDDFDAVEPIDGPEGADPFAGDSGSSEGSAEDVFG